MRQAFHLPGTTGAYLQHSTLRVPAIDTHTSVALTSSKHAIAHVLSHLPMLAAGVMGTVPGYIMNIKDAKSRPPRNQNQLEICKITGFTAFWPVWLEKSSAFSVDDQQDSGKAVLGNLNI